MRSQGLPYYTGFLLSIIDTKYLTITSFALQLCHYVQPAPLISHLYDLP